MNRRIAAALIFLIIIVVLFTKTREGTDSTTKNPNYSCPNCNVVLITVDALRPDHLGSYGYDKNTSPNIDWLAKDSVIFENAIAQYPGTSTNLASLLTSKYPTVHGVISFSTTLNDNFTTLVETLEDRGYSTAALVGNYELMLPDLNLGQGFQAHEPQRWYSPYISAKNLTDMAISQIQNYTEPYFLWIHYMDTYEPYLFQEGFIENFSSNANESEKRRILYDGEIRYLDFHLNRLFQILDFDKTILIISADHGESLGDHGYWGHERTLYEDQIGIPLIVKARGIDKGVRIRQPAETIDIGPTILALLGITYNYTHDGESLVPLMYGTGNTSKYAFSELLFPYSYRHLRVSPLVAVYPIYLGNNEYAFYLFRISCRENSKRLEECITMLLANITVFNKTILENGMVWEFADNQSYYIAQTIRCNDRDYALLFIMKNSRENIAYIPYVSDVFDSLKCGVAPKRSNYTFIESNLSWKIPVKHFDPDSADNFLNPYKFHQRAVMTEKWKFIKSAMGDELYNIREDPRETVNLIEERQDVATNLSEVLERFFENKTARYAPGTIELDEETREKLKALGYVV